MTVIKILEGQTITDIAVEALGDAGRSMELANLNGMGLTDDLVPGSYLNIPDVDIDMMDIVQLFTDPSLAPASDAGGTGAPASPEGIGYWYLENDFIIS